MSAGGPEPDHAPAGPLWEAAALPSGRAVAAATAAGALAAAVGGLVGFVGGWHGAVSVLIGAAVVLGVLWASAQVLIAGARRVSPPVALGLAMLIYLVAVVGLFLLAVSARSAAAGGGAVRPVGVAVGALAVLAAWTVALLVVHVRHDRPRRLRG